ncbi:hypothetical protein B0H10DRAFT_1960087 [Mycena sp. CBHHK59/15]|nr:hypothetical protein B0H10DRAFT_1960087 [Mycena sp. CBHHK59/15]
MHERVHRTDLFLAPTPAMVDCAQTVLRSQAGGLGEVGVLGVGHEWERCAAWVRHSFESGGWVRGGAAAQCVRGEPAHRRCVRPRGVYGQLSVQTPSESGPSRGGNGASRGMGCDKAGKRRCGGKAVCEPIGELSCASEGRGAACGRHLVPVGASEAMGRVNEVYMVPNGRQLVPPRWIPERWLEVA